jgi:hypothetical protein
MRETGDPNFLLRGTHQRPRGRLSLTWAAFTKECHQTQQEIRGKATIAFNGVDEQIRGGDKEISFSAQVRWCEPGAVLFLLVLL